MVTRVFLFYFYTFLIEFVYYTINHTQWSYKRSCMMYSAQVLNSGVKESGAPQEKYSVLCCL